MLFWFYIKDKCDHAGFWRPNFKWFESATGFRIRQKDFVAKMNSDKERIRVLPNGRWWLAGFVAFHFPKLSMRNSFHRSVANTLRANGIDEKSTTCVIDHTESIPRGQVEGRREKRDLIKNDIKDLKKKDINKGGVGGKHSKPFEPPTLEAVREYCLQNGFSGIAERAYKYYDAAQWKDSTGKQVKNWKQKLQGVWFKEENRDKPKPRPGGYNP